MKELKKYLRKEFPKQYKKVGTLVKLTFKPYSKVEKRLLVIGSEHGDKPFGAKAMIDLMQDLKQNKLEKTLIDFVPVIDVKGYPSKRTIIGEEGFGKPVYLDKGYTTTKKPKEILDLINIINASYDLAVQLNASFKDEAPILNGYFAIAPINTVTVDNKKRLVYDSVVKDVLGTVINNVKIKGFELLTADDNSYLGDGHILYGKGLVLPGIKDGDKISFKNRNAFVLKCAEKNVPAVLLYAAATSFVSKERSDAIEAHKTALEALIKLYEL